jgi:hypothetical protein
MRIQTYLQQIYRALAIGCMVYAVTLIADTAVAAEQPAAYVSAQTR